jgi:hypothetical protein
MFRSLRNVVARLLGRRPPGAEPSRDPSAGVRQPLRSGPGGRTSAIALMEPQPDLAVNAVAERPRRQ